MAADKVLLGDNAGEDSKKILDLAIARGAEDQYFKGKLGP
jgi:hypothetical protein